MPHPSASRPDSAPRGARAWAGFLGRAVMLWGAIGVLLGLVAYALDLAFILALAVVLRGLGATEAMPAFPRFLDGAGFHHGLMLLAVLHLLRSSVRWAGKAADASMGAAFRHRMRARLVTWVFGSRSVEGARAAHLFTEGIASAGRALSSLRLSAREALLAILLGAALCWVEPVLAAAGALGLAAFALAWRGVDRRFSGASRGLRRDSRRVLRSLGGAVRNLLLLRMHRLEQRERDRALVRLEKARRDARRDARITFLRLSVSQAVGTALGLGLIVLAFSRLDVEPAAFILFLYFYFRFSQSAVRAVAARQRFFRNLPALREVFRWWSAESARMDAPAEFPEGHPLRGRTRVDGPLGWELEGVDFAHSGMRPLFSSLSLRVAPGALLAISGPSGAGKTTLLQIMLGETAPGAGAVRAVVDGVAADIAPARALVLDHCAYSGPDPFLSGGTLRDNVTRGLQRPPDARRFAELAEMAQCGFVETLPDGWGHRITEQGSGLSAGQKQRLSLLRALLREPKALFLDEATSHLDAETEARVLAGLVSLRGRTTLVFVSHRPQVLAAADARLEL